MIGYCYTHKAEMPMRESKDKVDEQGNPKTYNAHFLSDDSICFGKGRPPVGQVKEAVAEISSIEESKKFGKEVAEEEEDVAKGMLEELEGGKKIDEVLPEKPGPKKEVEEPLTREEKEEKMWRDKEERQNKTFQVQQERNIRKDLAVVRLREMFVSEGGKIADAEMDRNYYWIWTGKWLK